MRDRAVEDVFAEFGFDLRGIGGHRQAKLDSLYERLNVRRVRNVLFVASLYDSFTFEEDGRLGDMIFNQYARWNLSTSPRIHRVSTAEEALHHLRQNEIQFDLIISLLRVGGKDIFQFLLDVKQLRSGLPVLLLACNLRELTLMDPRVDKAFRLNVHKRLGWESQTSSIDHIWTWPFVWTGDVRLLTGMIKVVEDRLNVQNDLEILPDIQLIILVEDGVRFYSSFVPLLYDELVKQTHAIMDDDYTMLQRLGRLATRPKIILTTSFEEAADVYNRYRDSVLAVITDGAYPKEGVHCETAGLQLLQLVRERTPDLPVLFQSANPANKAPAIALGADWVDKNKRDVLHSLRAFITSRLGFGPFIFFNSRNTQVGVASDLRGMIQALRSVPDDSVLHHARQNNFSTWLKARSEYAMSKALRRTNVVDFPDVSSLREFLINNILDHRSDDQEGLITDYSESTFGLGSNFIRLGSGSLGGKGRGLAFINALLSTYSIDRFFPNYTVHVPRTMVVSTSVFDEFVTEDLFRFILRESDDHLIAQAFLRGYFKPVVMAALRNYVTVVRVPIAVRSSSLFEDTFNQPFAGVYDSFMLPNNHSDIEVRLQQLCTAIKLVYASTFYHNAKVYAEAANYRIEELKMAVLIQEIIGEKHDEYFYPTASGVGRSVNFYPRDGMQSTDGLVMMAVGLGETVVGGGNCVRFSPAHPRRPYDYKSPEKRFKTTQKEFAALHLARSGVAHEGAGILHGNVVRLPVSVCEEHGELKYTGAVYVQEKGYITSDMSIPGPRLVTMDGLLKPMPSRKVAPGHRGGSHTGMLTEDSVKLATHLETHRGVSLEVKDTELASRANEIDSLPDLLSFLLRVSAAGLSCPVEIEFAVQVSKDPAIPHRFGFLQCRPFASATADHISLMNHLPPSEDTICWSVNALGHGRFDDVQDIVFVRPDRYRPGENTDVLLQELTELNDFLISHKRRFVLIGPGHWGTSDVREGIPVAWSQVSGAAVIVQTGTIGQAGGGSHFFFNLTTFGAGYLSVSAEQNEDFIAESWLTRQKLVEQSIPKRDPLTLIGHIHVDKPLDIRIDGVSHRGVIMKPNKDLGSYVSQVDAFLDLEQVNRAKL